MAQTLVTGLVLMFLLSPWELVLFVLGCLPVMAVMMGLQVMIFTGHDEAKQGKQTDQMKAEQQLMVKLAENQMHLKPVLDQLSDSMKIGSFGIDDNTRAHIRSPSSSSTHSSFHHRGSYENMKPKDAAVLFETMEPSFAAGFLGRMQTASAAQILSGLTPEKAYAISLTLSGRNINAPTD